jgi:hypothetical protein
LINDDVTTIVASNILMLAELPLLPFIAVAARAAAYVAIE